MFDDDHDSLDVQFTGGFSAGEFLERICKLLNDKRGDFHLLDNLEVVPFDTVPACTQIYVPCKKSHRDPTIADGNFWESCLGVKDVCGATCRGQVIRLSGPRGDSKDYMIWLGACKVCGKRILAAGQDFLMRLCYHAVFGLWAR